MMAMIMLLLLTMTTTMRVDEDDEDDGGYDDDDGCSDAKVKLVVAPRLARVILLLVGIAPDDGMQSRFEPWLATQQHIPQLWRVIAKFLS